MAESWYETLDRAKALGLEFAQNGIAGGETTPLEDPLYDDEVFLTPAGLVEDLSGSPETFSAMDGWEVADIASHWTDGYHSANWPGR